MEETASLNSDWESVCGDSNHVMTYNGTVPPIEITRSNSPIPSHAHFNLHSPNEDGDSHGSLQHSFLRVPVGLSGRSSPSVVSMGSEPESCIDDTRYMTDDDDGIAMTTPDSDSNADPFGGSDPPSAPLTFRAPPVSNCAKSIIDRKLRKYASETSFATETASESSLEREVPSRSRVFTVKPVGSRTPGGIVLTNGGSSTGQMNNGAAHRSRRRHDSDASGSANSEATVASGANTPRRCHFRRPKSTSEMHQSCTSATIHSLESHHNEERRASHVYMIDDDSVHEFEDDDDDRRHANDTGNGICVHFNL
ncbi:unnamed protein product [Caenorhabditis sp. 36 PRJEB53466]|nr:unnamed protein product [Caenorhabditis sp. 36 PRJEB53466]